MDDKRKHKWCYFTLPNCRRRREEWLSRTIFLNVPEGKCYIKDLQKLVYHRYKKNNKNNQYFADISDNLYGCIKNPFEESHHVYLRQDSSEAEKLIDICKIRSLKLNNSWRVSELISDNNYTQIKKCFDHFIAFSHFVYLRKLRFCFCTFEY